MVEIFVFCGWRFSNQFDIVLETHFSCDTVGCELWLAIFNLLLCPETNRNICIAKQGYVFVLSDFNSVSARKFYLRAIMPPGYLF